MKELIGKSLGRYEILDLLGEGGMGAVFKAHDTTLRRDLAIKVMHTRYAGQEDLRQRFMQEAQIAARLNHPCIVPVYDFGQQEDLLYIVMKYIPGDNLHQMLQEMRAQNQWILLDEAVQIIIQLCHALDYAHRHGILHRDLKPANIMLEPEAYEELPYRPVLTDLGLAKLVEGGLKTQVGISMGTPAYMSPEQAMGKEIDSRSDVYSLGVLLFELVVGRLPFEIKTITEAVRCHTQEAPPAPRSLRPGLPEPLEAIILKTLAKDPADRYTDAGSLANALKEFVPYPTGAAGPAITEGSASLITQYQQSLLSWRGTSLMQDFRPAPDALENTSMQIQVVQSDKTTYMVPLKPAGILVGRVADNDLTLQDAKASRKHARIEFIKGKIWVTDLNSSNGTFLNKTRLLAGVPEEWPAGVSLRIGDTYLQLVAGEALPEHIPSRSEKAPLPSPVERISLRLENAQLAVEPGSSSQTILRLQNTGKLVDTFHISVAGLPEGWFQGVEPVHLDSGEQKEIKITLAVPREPRCRAGRYPFGIIVASQDDPEQFKEIKATLSVGAYAEFQSRLNPQKIRARENARVTVENLGNVPEVYNLTWQDRGDELVFSPPSAQLRVAEGQSAVAEFSAEPREKRWIGGEKSHSVTAQVNTTAGAAQTHTGELISRGVIPSWGLFFIPIILIILTWLLTQAKNPEILSWQVTPLEVIEGESVTLAWKVLDAEKVNITNLGDVPIEGNRSVQPSQTTEFVLVASNRGKEREGVKYRVVVKPPPIVSPEIVSFVVEPDQFTAGQVKTIHFAWETKNADTVRIEPGIGEVVLTGSLDPLAPSADTVYTLVAINAGIEAKEQRTVKVQIPGDRDGDDLTDIDEIEMGTDPDNPDSDSDGLNDGEEVIVYQTMPLIQDTDGDGLLDGEETTYTTKPLIYDTDIDGLNDGEEIKTHKTDPVKNDTDGDTLFDGKEIKIGTNPTDRDTDRDGIDDNLDPNPLIPIGQMDDDYDDLSNDEEAQYQTDKDDSDSDDDELRDGEEVKKYGTSPIKRDTDEDGLDDRYEVNSGLDPNSPDTDNDCLNDSTDKSQLVPEINSCTVQRLIVRNRLSGHKDKISELVFSPNGSYLASASKDSTIRIWEPLSSSPPIKVLTGHLQEVTSLAFYDAGRYLVSGSLDATIRSWDSLDKWSYSTLMSGQKGQSIFDLDITGDGKFLTYALGVAVQKNRNTGDQYIFQEEPMRGAAMSVAYSPDGQNLAIGVFAGDITGLGKSYDDCLSVWQTSTHKHIITMADAGNCYWVSKVDFSTDGDFLITLSLDGDIRVWSIARPEPLRTIDVPGDASSLAISNGAYGFLIATGTKTGEVILWDRGSGEMLARYKKHGAAVTSLAFSQDGNYLASGSEDGLILFWSVK